MTGVHAETGLTTGDAEESALKSTMLRAAALSDLTLLVTPGTRPDSLPAGVAHLQA